MRPIAVVGPTASGKSALGLALAHELDGEVVNVDSMQLYRGMDIGTAKLRGARWHSAPPARRVGRDGHCFCGALSASRPARYRGHYVPRQNPILVGGSMLYAQALVDDWQFPPTDPHVRAKYEARRADIGTDALHAELARVDPAAAAIIEDKDPRRTVRALEVIELTGKPFKASQPPKNGPTRWGRSCWGCGLTVSG